MATKLSSKVNEPQPTEAGDAPADTTDAKERAVAVEPDKAAAAQAGHTTVNAVVPSTPFPDAPAGGVRTETYKARDNAGKEITVTHDLDTGKSTVSSGG